MLVYEYNDNFRFIGTFDAPLLPDGSYAKPVQSTEIEVPSDTLLEGNSWFFDVSTEQWYQDEYLVGMLVYVDEVRQVINEYQWVNKDTLLGGAIIQLEKPISVATKEKEAELLAHIQVTKIDNLMVTSNGITFKPSEFMQEINEHLELAILNNVFVVIVPSIASTPIDIKQVMIETLQNKINFNNLKEEFLKTPLFTGLTLSQVESTDIVSLFEAFLLN